MEAFFPLIVKFLEDKIVVKEYKGYMFGHNCD